MEAVVKTLVGLSIAIPSLRAAIKGVAKYGGVTEGMTYLKLKLASTDPIFTRIVTREKKRLFFWRWGRAINTMKYNYAYFWEYNEQLRRESQFGYGDMYFTGPRGTIEKELDYGMFNADYVHPIYGSGKWAPMYNPRMNYMAWRLRAVEGEEDDKKKEEEEQLQQQQGKQDPLLKEGLGFMIKMNQEEAGLILGLSLGDMANERKVKNAYKKAMFANHPDKGGSKFIALKLSEAKDYLLSTVKETKTKEKDERKAAAEEDDKKKEGSANPKADEKANTGSRQGSNRRR